MSSRNSSSVLDQLVSKARQSEQETYNEANQKTLAQGITSYTLSPMEPTSQTNPPVSNSVVPCSRTKSNICPRCGKPVYFAEEVKAVGQSFHKLCYKCAKCKKSINGASYSEHNGNLYDNNCYQRLFGPKGVGYGIGAGVLSTGN